jgi:hypothetical protein
MRHKPTQVLSVVLAIAILVPLTNCKRYSPNRDDVKLKEVERLYNALPIYAGFQAIAGSSYSKSMLASVSKSYRSDAPYDDVKNFYSARLIPEGWQLSKERNLKDWSRDYGGRELTFEKGEYSVVIEYRGDRAIDPDWNYAINVGWDDK